MERHDSAIERHLADALRRLNAETVVPPVDEAREAALLAAFDAARAEPRRRWRREYGYLAAFAAAAALIIVAGLGPAAIGRRGHSPGRATVGAPHADVRLEPPNDFVIVPGAVGLPPMESGTLVRLDVPVSLLPSLGVTPPAGRASTITADFIVAQDGLPRAVRVVAP